MKTRNISLRAAFALASAGATLAGCVGPGDVYPVAVEEAYRKLAEVRIEPAKDGPFYRLRTRVSGNGRDEVVWSVERTRCAIGLKPKDAARTHVTVECKGPEAAGADYFSEHWRKQARFRAIELVDATLNGRSFDPKLAGGETAVRWPADDTKTGYSAAVGSAFKMAEEDAKLQASQRQSKR